MLVPNKLGNRRLYPLLVGGFGRAGFVGISSQLVTEIIALGEQLVYNPLPLRNIISDVEFSINAHVIDRVELIWLICDREIGF